MDKFELYMINTLKIWTDKLIHESNFDIRWMEKNVLAELITTFVYYETSNNEYNIEEELPFSDDTILLD